MIDISKTSSNVFGIVGMGIGLGLLAHTVNNIARSTDRIYDREYQRRSQRINQYSKRRTSRQKPIRMNISRSSFNTPFTFNSHPISLIRSNRSFKW